MPEDALDRKPDKVGVLWFESLISFAEQLLIIVFYKAAVITFFRLLLSLTSVLWAPQEWLYWLQTIFLISETPTWVDVDKMIGNNTAGPCKTLSEKRDAVSGPTIDVSGWYGPGAFLAWLFTAYVASISSIWHSKSSRKPEQKHIMEGELLAALTYPLVAVFDILYRFIRCRLDPGINAAFIVIYHSIAVLGPARRLSWQVTGKISDDADETLFPPNAREWIWAIFQIICHILIWSTIAEPYTDPELIITIYSLGTFVLLYSEIRTERLRDRYPYRLEEHRPRHERIAVFILIQIIFFIVLMTTRHSIFPGTGSSLSDLDQGATLFTVIFAMLFTKAKGILGWISGTRSRLMGFAQLQQNSEDRV